MGRPRFEHFASATGEVMLEKLIGTVAPMVNALAHGAALQWPASLSKSDALDEAVRAVVGYLQSGR